MTNDAKVKQLIKILIAAAWIDGKIQPEERRYLQQLAQEKGVASDAEIQPLLHELKSVQQSDCYEWVKEYLGDRPSSEAWQNLIEAISGLIYRDNEVAIEEAKLLTKLQSMEIADSAPQSGYAGMLKEIQKLYRRWVDQQG